MDFTATSRVTVIPTRAALGADIDGVDRSRPLADATIKAIGNLGHYEAEWHTDMSYNPITPLGSLLYSLEVPPEGGDTGFSNMYAAFDALPAALQRAIVVKSCKHDASRNSVGELRKGYRGVSDPREAPGAVHPIVRTHPATRRNALFLGRRRNAYIVGLPLAG